MILKYRAHLIYYKLMIAARARTCLGTARRGPNSTFIKFCNEPMEFLYFHSTQDENRFLGGWLSSLQRFSINSTPENVRKQKRLLCDQHQVSSNARLWPLGCTFLNVQIKRNVLLSWCNYSVLKAPSVTIITASFTECYNSWKSKTQQNKRIHARRMMSFSLEFDDTIFGITGRK